MAKAEYWDERNSQWVLKTSERGQHLKAIYGDDLITRSSPEGKAIDKIRFSATKDVKKEKKEPAKEIVKKEKKQPTKETLTHSKKQLQDMCTAAGISRSGNKSELATKLKNSLVK